MQFNEEQNKNPSIKIKKKTIYNHTIADEICNKSLYAETLAYFEHYDSFAVYQKERGYYKIVDDRQMHRLLLQYLRANFQNRNITISYINDIYSLIKLMVNKSIKEEDWEYISFKDCLLNMKTMAKEDHSNDKYCTFQFDFNLDDIEKTNLQENAPTFYKFLSTSFVKSKDDYETDTEMIDYIHRMMGFLLIPNLKGATSFFLYGEGANGKSVLLEILRNIFTREFSSSMSLSKMGEKYSLPDLVGKRINISPEEDDKFIKSRIFKSIISGDTITGERKYGSTFQFDPKLKFIFATNVLPNFDQGGYSIQRRINIIPFYRVFSPEERDHELVDKICKEIPAIVYWMIEGAREVMNNNYTLGQPPAVQKAQKEFLLSSSTPLDFLSDKCLIITPEMEQKGYKKKDFLKISDLYFHYKEWCYNNGKKYLSRRNFSTEIGTEKGISIEKTNKGIAVNVVMNDDNFFSQDTQIEKKDLDVDDLKF